MKASHKSQRTELSLCLILRKCQYITENRQTVYLYFMHVGVYISVAWYNRGVQWQNILSATNVSCNATALLRQNRGVLSQL